ncbi:NifU family protein [Helicobacter mustelae]|uniref:NifU protein homolog n=1 Tax=Helicobacter mustelae (strain ATCC 43772 / CCUG 25715 / CIP 103759 / LMG 18044 / NCTC 12198 / R85-136P) TaxID=679897 RepID=D3UHC4_HELM1|nr:NifU family protein [Helicobacter mustelae]CBG39896.1 nifU protein homolog [Helicobacter mustelae 12198]SQH71407.1 NifU-like protein [Helicobacter mustelae]STP12535.1 NifU-like protein [Helicobacter mustelae]
MFPFGDEELQKPVEMSIEKTRPHLLADGGDIAILGIRGPCVYVRLKGACVGCAHSHITLKNAIERQLKIDIHPDMKVVHVPDGRDWKEFIQN